MHPSRHDEDDADDWNDGYHCNPNGRHLVPVAPPNERSFAATRHAVRAHRSAAVAPVYNITDQPLLSLDDY